MDINEAVNKAVNDELVKHLKAQLCDVNRNIRNFRGDMGESEVFRKYITERLELRNKIDALK